MAWLRADGKASAVDLSAMFDRSAGVLDQREGRDIREWADKATATRMSSHKVYGAGEPVTDEAKAWARCFAGRLVSTCTPAFAVYIL